MPKVTQREAHWGFEHRQSGVEHSLFATVEPSLNTAEGGGLPKKPLCEATYDSRTRRCPSTKSFCPLHIHPLWPPSPCAIISPPTSLFRLFRPVGCLELGKKWPFLKMFCSHLLEYCHNKETNQPRLWFEWSPLELCSIQPARLYTVICHQTLSTSSLRTVSYFSFGAASS